MALGKTHDRAIILTAPIVAIASFLTLPMHWAIAAAIGHLFGGIFLSPDLDTVSKPYHRWGLLKYYWLPYQKLCKHRGMSHTPVFGTLGRELYLFAPVVAIALYQGVEIPWEYWKEAAAFTAGVELSALVHLKLDGLL